MCFHVFHSTSLYYGEDVLYYGEICLYYGGTLFVFVLLGRLSVQCGRLFVLHENMYVLRGRLCSKAVFFSREFEEVCGFWLAITILRAPENATHVTLGDFIPSSFGKLCGIDA